jgi:positive regulator of sigma E activity
MNQLLSLKQHRIKKDMLQITLEEKKQIRTRSLLYLGIFVILFIGMVILDPNPTRVDAGDSLNENAAGFLKFIAGKFLVASLYFGYRTYRTSKEIRALKKGISGDGAKAEVSE